MDIGRILIKHGLLTPGQVDAAQQEAGGLRLDRYVIEQGLVSEDRVLQAFAREFGMPFVDLSTITVDQELLALIPTREIFRLAIFPIRRCHGAVQVATSDPLNLEAMDELRTITGLRLETALARRQDIDRLIKDQLGLAGGTVGELVAQRAGEDVELLEPPDDLPQDADDTAQQVSVIKLVNELLVDAISQRASDVHLEPEENGLQIRFRVDGMLRVQPVPPEIHQFRDAMISRLKIVARLNIAEKRLPQDGRIKLRIAGRDIDIRVSVIPMLHGEGIVLRLLDRGRMLFSLGSLEFPPEVDASFRRLITRPHGILLVTGPTGSGKTTTLYSALSGINRTEVKIITIEDPVEYRLAGARQIQAHAKIGLTFAAGLRSILRHDPDVILIGEIRDSETAASAIQAALTGHLVFSTLHTNDSCSAFTRLIDMGVEPYLVASTVEGVMAQRLVRRLCLHCREEYSPPADELPADFPRPLPKPLWKARGCRECHNTGYSGRVAVFELLETDGGIKQLCTTRASASEMRQYAFQHGFVPLRRRGWDKVLQGVTSVEEIVRVTSCDFEETQRG